MHLREAVASFFHVLVILLFFSIAFFCCCFPMQPDWRELAISWIQDTPAHFYWMGAIFAAAGLVFLLVFFGVGRGRFMRLLVKPYMVSVDAKLLQQVVESCFQTRFPRSVASTMVNLNGQHLDVLVDLLPLHQKKQERLLCEMERQLLYLLRERFGYQRPFSLSVRFRC